MMYKSQFVAAIKIDTQFLREEGETVYLPFGSEYAIYLKNLNQKQRAVLNITIDGKSISGNGLVLGAGESSVSERPVDHNRKFKFIERTSAIENHRGVGLEDGLVVINYQFEEVEIFNPQTLYACSTGIPRSFGANCSFTMGGAEKGISYESSVSSSNQIGITGMGSVSSQTYGQTRVRRLEHITHTIIFRLLGGVNNQQVSQPVYTKTRKVCNLCGKSYSSNISYCPDDGNALQFVNNIF